MTAGVETMKFAGVDVLVTSPSRTVIDMLRLSSKAGGGEQPMRALRDFIYAASTPPAMPPNSGAMPKRSDAAIRWSPCCAWPTRSVTTCRARGACNAQGLQQRFR